MSTINRMSKVFYTGNYSKDHWAMQPCLLSQPNMVALATFKEFEYAAYLHPTDKRGCRVIVVLKCDADMTSTFNRPYTSHERIGLGLLAQMLQEVYSKIFPIAQSANAGNNAHEFDKDSGLTLLGTPHEPVRLNAHIFGRGNPKQQYIKGVALDGPEPGEIFNLRADGPEPGNDKPVPWTRSKIRHTVVPLRLGIEEIKGDYESLGLTVYTSGYPHGKRVAKTLPDQPKNIEKLPATGKNLEDELVTRVRKLSSS